MPTLQIDGATVAFSDTGAPSGVGNPEIIVFGHGLLFSGWMFAEQIEALRSRYRCVAIDWRGQGATPPAHGGYDMDTLALDAAAIIESLGVGSVHYVGLSMGGFVGLRLAARRPELIRSLTLLDTSADPEVPSAALQDKLLAMLFRAAGLGPVRGPVQKIMFGPAFLADPRSPALIDEWMRQVATLDRAAVRQAVLGVANRKGVAGELGNIVAPTLVVVGEQDKPTPVARARRIHDGIAGSRLEIVPDCGHSSSIEQPKVLTDLIGEFVASVPTT